MHFVIEEKSNIAYGNTIKIQKYVCTINEYKCLFNSSGEFRLSTRICIICYQCALGFRELSLVSDDIPTNLINLGKNIYMPNEGHDDLFLHAINITYKFTGKES